jgi:glycosyltransferase involved in cell wall biosynthesis
MRIVLDLQGCQSASKHRGIGRYSLGLAKALVCYDGGHEYWVAMNGRLPISDLRETFEPHVSREHLKVFEVPGAIACCQPENAWRANAAELIRESFIASLKPDIVHISSIFEGFIDDAVTSVPVAQGIKTAATLYDLIPFLNPESIRNVPHQQPWYEKKIEHLRRAKLLLAISEHSRQEAINALNISGDKIVNISAGVDERFRTLPRGSIDVDAIRTRYGLIKPFVMCNMSGFEPHKNIDGLIKATVQLPKEIRDQYQLVIVGDIQHHAIEVERIGKLCEQIGWEQKNVVFTNDVSDEDLVTLYNLCHLFVMPSLREEFCLPAVEAMRCGAAVITSNTSSFPEVIGCDDALFSPHDPKLIAAKIHEALTNERFRQSLKERGPVQAGKFTWEECAKKASAAFHALGEKRGNGKKKPRLAFISPLPPERSGISDYSDELLGHLNQHYEIDLVSLKPNEIEQRILFRHNAVSVEKFEIDAHKYDRVLYQFGNSPFHTHMFSLLERYPGTVVLHDFFLSAVLNYIEHNTSGNPCFQNALYRSHGYFALKYAQQLKIEAIQQFPCCKGVIDFANGVIVHSDHVKELCRTWFGSNETLRTIPQLRSLPAVFDRQQARVSLGLRDDELLVASFGHLADTKLNERLLSAWLKLPLQQKTCRHLVFVGEATGEYGASLREMISKNALDDNVTITGFVDREVYELYLQAVDVTVQLRTASRGESSRSVLDCLAYGIPTIINAHGTMVDIPSHAVVKLADRFSDDQLADSLQSLLQDEEGRRVLGGAGRSYVAEHHDPKKIAHQYFLALEHFAVESRYAKRNALLESLHGIRGGEPECQDLVAVAANMAANERCGGHPRVFVDVSGIRSEDCHTGIQRVVRAILFALIEQEKMNYRVEPVFFCRETNSIRYARNFGTKISGSLLSMFDEPPIEYTDGDIFLGLDWYLTTLTSGRHLLEAMRNRGVGIFFVIYDLLPVLQPKFFPEWLEPQFAEWLTAIAAVADGTMCISKSVAHELHHWLDRNVAHRKAAPLNIGYFHLGCDVERSVPTSGISDAFLKDGAKIKSRPFMLMVGTIEPRKGHAQTISAFDLLWQHGLDVNLVIVGRAGWMVDHVIERLRTHPQTGKRLFWFDKVSDELLLQLYQSATCLIAASEGEGFGLPLVEAARHKVPIVARDLPVFKEVGGAHAHYFSGNTPEELADALSHWLAMREQNSVAMSEHIQQLTWAQSAEQLLRGIQGDWLFAWPQRPVTETDPWTLQAVAECVAE